MQRIARHRRPQILAPPTILRDRTGMVTITSRVPATIRHTLDGSEPGSDSPTYTAPFPLPRGGTVRELVEQATGTAVLLVERGGNSRFIPIRLPE